MSGPDTWRRSKAIDDELILDDGAVGAGAGYSVVGNNIAQVGGGNGFLDLLESLGASPVMVMKSWFNIISSDDGDADETYQIQIQESDTSNFAVIRKDTREDFARGTEDAQIGISFTPKYRYARANYVCGGTTPNLKIEQAWVTPEPQ